MINLSFPWMSWMSNKIIMTHLRAHYVFVPMIEQNASALRFTFSNGDESVFIVLSGEIQIFQH